MEALVIIVIVIVYQCYWIYGLCPLPDILKRTQHFGQSLKIRILIVICHSQISLKLSTVMSETRIKKCARLSSQINLKQ